MAAPDQNLNSEGSSSTVPEASPSSAAGADAALEHHLLELADQATRRMETRLAEIETATVTRVEQDTSKVVSGVREVLLRSIQQQIPALEREVLERCRLVSESMLAAQVEQWTLLLSDRFQKAQQTLRESLEAAEAEAVIHRDENMAGRSEQLLQECAARLEQQMDRVGIRVRQSFLRQVGLELTRSQRHWLEQAQRQLDHVAEQNLRRTRRNISEMLRQIGETLLRQSYIEADAPGSARPEASPVVAETTEPSSPAGVKPPHS
jgi:hypothetical protein